MALILHSFLSSSLFLIHYFSNFFYYHIYNLLNTLIEFNFWLGFTLSNFILFLIIILIFNFFFEDNITFWLKRFLNHLEKFFLISFNKIKIFCKILFSNKFFSYSYNNSNNLFNYNFVLRTFFKKIKKKSKSYFKGFKFLFIKLKLNNIWNQQLLKKSFFLEIRDLYLRLLGPTYFYLRGIFLICFIDACLTDDEPLWEPLEWSLFQTWLFFIFIFSWIAENLITSRYGSYTGRDKRVWFAWYRTFWGIEAFFVMSMGATCLFIIVPFYYEITYNISFVINWWNWYTKTFFLKLFSILVLLLTISNLLLLGSRWLNWKKLFFITLLVNIFFLYLIYIQFITTFFSFFTDPLWYQKTRCIDYIQLSHEPLKWGFGPAKRDHFAYHNVSTVFWYKNDQPFAASMLFISLMMFLSTFLVYFYWLILLRRIYTTQEISLTYLVYSISTLKQFFYFYFLFFIFIFFSWIMMYWRFPIEFSWLFNNISWIYIYFYNFIDYPKFILQI